MCTFLCHLLGNYLVPEPKIDIGLLFLGLHSCVLPYPGWGFLNTGRGSPLFTIRHSCQEQLLSQEQMHSLGREKQVQELGFLLSPVPPQGSAPAPLASPQWPHPRRSHSQECWLTVFSHMLLRDGSPLGLAAVFVPAVSSTCPPQGLQCAWGLRALLREGSFQGKECMYLGWAPMAGSQR